MLYEVFIYVIGIERVRVGHVANLCVTRSRIFIAGLLWATGGGPWDLCRAAAFLLQFLVQSVPPKSGRPKRRNIATSQGHDAVHHLDEVDKYLQVCNFSNFIKILLNYVPNDFLQQG
jgi:hypothetical protein